MKFVVNGGKRLSGTIKVNGSKNAALPVIAATLLTRRPCVIDNVPRIKDVMTLVEILEAIGSDVEWLGRHKVKITNVRIDPKKLPKDLVRRIRASVLLLGPLLARFGEVKFYTPGGCHIGARPLDAHFEPFKELGFDIKHAKKNDLYTIKRARKAKVKTIVLKEFSVTATENLLMYASLNPLTIKIAAAEPHVRNTGEFLIKLGAKINGLGTHTVSVMEKIKASGGEVRHRILPDYIEAGTFMVLGAVTRSNITVKDVPVDDMTITLRKLEEFGVNFDIRGSDVYVKGSSSALKAASKISTGPYPGFPTDLQAPFGLLATQAEGNTLIIESLYEGRLKYLYELDKMGAAVDIMDPHRALIKGPKKLVGKNVEGIDIRAGITLIIAALAAKGESVLHGAEQVDRGYEKIEERLQALGADIKREE